MKPKPSQPAGLRPTSNAITNPAPKKRDWQAAELEGAQLWHARRAAKRDWMQALRVANAAKQLRRLPEPGESIHCVMRGNFNAWDLIPAALELMAPATIQTLRITTLGFNRRNAAQLLELHEAGKIQRCLFVCSIFYERGEGGEGNKQLCQALAKKLEAYGGRFCSIRNHSKVQTFDTTDGNAYTIESSANLRSCHTIEQFTLTNDPDLLAFHAQWIDQVFDHGEKEDEQKNDNQARHQKKQTKGRRRARRA